MQRYRQPRFDLWGCLLVAGCLTICGPLHAADFDFSYPLSAVVAKSGETYVADSRLPGVWKVTPTGAEPYFTAAKKFRTPLNGIRCLAMDEAGRLLAGDSATREIYRFDESGQPQPLTDGQIGTPMSIAVNGDGQIFVSDAETQRIWKVPAAGGKPIEFAQVASPRGLAFDSTGQLWVVSPSSRVGQLLRINADGSLESMTSGRPFKFPHSIAFDANDNAYVSDGYAATIFKIAPAGKPEPWIVGKPLLNPMGLARAGNQLLISDPHAKIIFTAGPDGQLSRLANPP